MGVECLSSCWQGGGCGGWLGRSGGLRSRDLLLARLLGGLLDRRVADRRPGAAGPWAGLGSIRRVSAWQPASRARTGDAETRAAPDRVTVAAGVGAAPTAAAGRRRSGGPGAAGCRRPAPARSTGRPARGGADAGSSSPGSACRSGRCAPGRTGGCTPARPGPGPGAPGPAHHSHSTLGGRVRAGTRSTCTRMMVPRTIGRGPPVPWPGWRCCLGCSPLQAATVTVPYWSSIVTRVAVGVGQVVGSAQANLAPWRRGRPVLPGGRGGGSA